MFTTHWAINRSDACDEGGNGQCEGTVPEGEGNTNAISDECTCACHRDLDAPLTIEGMLEYHETMFA